MANTLQNLFPFSTIQPNNATVYPVSVTFSAPIIAGQYVFNDTTTPPQVFGRLPQDQTGVIAGVMIGANCAPEDFAANVGEPLKLQILNGSNKTPVNMSPFPFTQFAHGDNYACWWNITGAAKAYEDNFLLQVSGAVKQIANMTDNELKLKISFNYWRIAKKELTGENVGYFEKLLKAIRGLRGL